MMTTGRQAMKIVERLVQIETSMVCPGLLPMFSVNLTKHRHRQDPGGPINNHVEQEEGSFVSTGH